MKGRRIENCLKGQAHPRPQVPPRTPQGWGVAALEELAAELCWAWWHLSLHCQGREDDRFN